MSIKDEIALGSRSLLGVTASFGEVMILTTSGVYCSGNVRRRPEELRWNAECAQMIVAVPWIASENGPLGEQLDQQLGRRLIEEEVKIINTSSKPPLSFTITKGDVEIHGGMADGLGCSALISG